MLKNKFNKIYDDIKEYIKENYLFLIFLILFAVVMNIRVPYYIFSGGGVQDLSKRFELKEEYETKGSYNLSYVTELRGTVLSYGLSYIIPDWERVKVSNYQINENESLEELSLRNKIDLDHANQTAINLAYSKAGKTFTIKEEKYYIYYIIENTDTELKVGDRILEVDGKKINNLDEIASAISNKKENDEVSVKVLRDEKEKTVKSKIKIEDNKALLGISLIVLYDYETNPKIELKFKENESGSSAGLMLTLAIYDALIEEDLTNGRKIAGTGTISSDGTVGAIGGVRYKLMGAEKKNADIFIVPIGENYEECIKLKEEKGYDIEVIGVSTFDEAITSLKK